VINFSKTFKFVSVLSGIALVAFALSRSPIVVAQSSNTTPIGTFTCLINANYSGYLNKTSNSNDPQSVNALLVFNFTSSSASLTAVVVNEVNDFEGPSPTTVTNTSLPNPIPFSLTPLAGTSNILKLQSNTPGDVPYYIAVVNSGNSLLFMSAPSNDKVHNGACQKV
jgi:hypothetical protein